MKLYFTLQENAHFCISEAIISAVEQIKCKQLFQRHSDNESDGSDEEIQALKQRIRIRRKERRRDRVLSEDGGAQGKKSRMNCFQFGSQSCWVSTI